MTLSEPQVECEDSGYQEGTVSDTTTSEEPITTKIKLGRGKQSIVLEFEDEGRNYEATIDISDICIKFKGFVDQIVGKNSHGKKVNVDTSSQDSKHSDETTRANSEDDKECKADQTSTANSLSFNKKKYDSKSDKAIFNEKLMLNNKSSEINKEPNDLKKANDKNKGDSEVDRFSNAKPLTISPSSAEELKRVLTFPQVFKSPLKDVNKIPEKQIDTIRNCAEKLKVNSGDEKENKAAVNFLAKSMASDKNPDGTKFDSAAIIKKLNEKPDWIVKSSKELKDLSNLFNNSTNKKEDFTGVEKTSNDPLLNVPKLEPKCSIDPIPSWEEFSKELRNNKKLFTLGKSKKIRSVNKKFFVSLRNSTFEIQIPKENSIPPPNSKCSNEVILPRSSSPVAARTVVESAKEKVVSSTKSVDSDRRENSIESTTKLTEEKPNLTEVAPITSKKCQDVTDSTDKSVKDEPASNIDSVAKPVGQPVTKQEPVITNRDGSNKGTGSVSNHEDITSAQKSITQSTSDQSQKDFTSKLENEKLPQKLDPVTETSNLKETNVSSSSDNSNPSSLDEKSSIPQVAKFSCRTKEKVVSSTKSVDSNRRENSIESTTNLAEGKSNSAEVASITSKRCQDVTDSTDKLLKEKDEGKYPDASKKSIKDEPASNIDSVAKPVKQPATKQEPVITNTDHGSNKDTAPVSNHEDITSAQKSTIQSTSDRSQKDFASKVENEKIHQKLNSVTKTSNLKETNVSSSGIGNSTSSTPNTKSSILQEAKISCRTTTVKSEVKCVNEKLQGQSQLIKHPRPERASSAEISEKQKPVVPDVESDQKSKNDDSSKLRDFCHDELSFKGINVAEKEVTCDATSKTIKKKPIATVKGCPRRNVTSEQSSEPSGLDRTTNSTSNNDHSAVVRRTTYYEPDRTTISTSNNDHSAAVRRRIYYEPDLYEGGLIDSLLRDLQFSSPVSRYSRSARTDIFEDVYREPFLNISGIGRTKKFNAFMQCPGDKRPVTDLPGVGEKGGQRLRALGFETAGKVHQQYLRFGRDKSAFQGWLWNVAGLNRRWSSQCFDALEMMG